jgi:hypothetical protein
MAGSQTLEEAPASAPRDEEFTSPQVPSSLSGDEDSKGTLLCGLFSEFSLSEIISSVVQLISIIAAFTFGVWAIKSYNAAQRANSLTENGLRQTLTANQLALLSLCMSNQVSPVSPLRESSSLRGGLKSVKRNPLT